MYDKYEKLSQSELNNIALRKSILIVVKHDVVEIAGMECTGVQLKEALADIIRYLDGRKLKISMSTMFGKEEDFSTDSESFAFINKKRLAICAMLNKIAALDSHIARHSFGKVKYLDEYSMGEV